ncbi:hypothetical protein IFR05_016897 [Cadophora sp. M221]|nr:hypothetical protein IFR05_016897 [Cadophora sp. M221]
MALWSGWTANEFKLIKVTERTYLRDNLRAFGVFVRRAKGTRTADGLAKTVQAVKNKWPEDHGGSGSGNKKFKADETPPKTPSQRFACPFQKHDPADVSYDGTKGRYRSCTGVGFPTIARLKEHLIKWMIICWKAYVVNIDRKWV